VTTAAGALAKTVPSIAAASMGENGTATTQSPERGVAKEPPLFQKNRPDWEIKFADVTNRALSVMPGESDKTVISTYPHKCVLLCDLCAFRR